MCTTCKMILGKYAKPHGIPCPLSKALYCNRCAVYGHTAKRCINNFENNTSIPENIKPYNNPYKNTMVLISDMDGPIRAALISNGITPMTCQEKGKKVQRDFIENKKRLKDYLNEQNLSLVLIKQKYRD